MLEHDGNFWNEIKHGLDHDQKSDLESDISKLALRLDYIPNIDCSTHHGEYHDNKSKPWPANHHASVSMKKKNEEIQNKKDCFWMQLTNIISQKLYTQTEKDSDYLVIVKRLVKSYFDITGKKAIDINKNFNFLFSVYRKQICIEIQRINSEHTGGRKSSDCAVCKENFESPFFPYILLYCLLSCKKNMIPRRLKR